MENNYVPLTTKIKGYLFEVIIKGKKRQRSAGRLCKKVLIGKPEMLLIKVVFCRMIEWVKEKVGLFFWEYDEKFQ